MNTSKCISTLLKPDSTASSTFNLSHSGHGRIRRCVHHFWWCLSTSGFDQLLLGDLGADTVWDTVHKSLLKLVFRRKQELTKQPPVERVDAEGDVRAHPTTPSGRNLDWRRWLTWLPGIFWFSSLIPVFLFYKESAAKDKALLDISSPGWDDNVLDIEPDIGGKYAELLNVSVTTSNN